MGLALVSSVAAAAIVNAFADQFLRWVRPSAPPGRRWREGPPTAVRFRPEERGGIVAWSAPPALLFVDEAGAAAALEAGATPIGGRPAPAGALSAPTEVHVAVTDRCPASCDACYLDAGPDRPGADPDLDQIVDQLADLGVFEVALGGGEALLRDDLIELATAIRARGMVPNLTTSGFGLTPARARRMAEVMGQVNVSLDGLGETYRAVRGWDGEALGLRAIRLLREAGLRVGVNTVLCRQNVEQLEEVAAALRAEGVAEWQWLRLKPSGRGAARYADLALTPDQARSLWPLALRIERTPGLVLRWDCALVPFLAAHGPPVEALEALGIAGCPGGHSLMVRSADGRWAPCSFAHDTGAPGDPGAAWESDPTLVTWRARAEAPPEPCGSCAYRRVCRGGCRVVAGHVTGDPLAPDPECPRVLACG